MHVDNNSDGEGGSIQEVDNAHSMHEYDVDYEGRIDVLYENGAEAADSMAHEDNNNVRVRGDNVGNIVHN